MPSMKIIFSSKEEIVCHLPGCHFVKEIDDVIEADIMISRHGLPLGLRPCKVCGEELQSEAKRQGSIFAKYFKRS